MILLQATSKTTHGQNCVSTRRQLIARSPCQTADGNLGLTQDV